MPSDDKPRRRLQYTLKAILALTAVVAVIVTGLWYHLRVTIVLVLVSPMVTTPLFLFVALSSSAKEQRLDLRGNPWLWPFIYVCAGSWLLAFGVAVGVSLWLRQR